MIFGKWIKMDKGRVRILSGVVAVAAVIVLLALFAKRSSLSDDAFKVLYIVFFSIGILAGLSYRMYTKPRWSGSGLQSEQEMEQDRGAGKNHTIAIDRTGSQFVYAVRD
jgi:hypothetical protein